MKVTVCNCTPEGHGRLTSTDTKLIRRVRKNSLEQADRCEAMDDERDKETAICARYTAHLCLVRLQELRKAP